MAFVSRARASGLGGQLARTSHPARLSPQIVSIVGRKVASAPVPGDVELLQLCAAFASASFFAWCHLNHGDVKVDFFTNRLGPRAIATLDALGSLLVGLFGALIAWRSLVGALSVKEAGEITAILGWPVWIGQMLMIPGFVLLALTGFYMAVHHLRGSLHPARGHL